MTSKSIGAEPNLRRKMMSGSFWMMGVNIFERSLGLVSTVILARLLVPEDFGLVAMASVFMAFVQVLNQFGLDAALIQRQDASREHYDTAWTFSILFGIVSGGVLAILAWPATEYYQEPKVFLVMLAFALSVAIRGFQNIGIVRFRKDLEFRREFNFMAGIKICSFIITITIAAITRSYWALVIGTLAANIVAVILSYVLHDFRPRISVAKTKDLFSFSIWIFLNNTLLMLRTRGGDLIVGKVLGPLSLGLFTIGYEIARLPTTELIAPINRAVFPGYARIASDSFRLRSAFLNVISIIAMVVLPAAVGIAVVSDLAIPLLLGEKWVAAVPLVQVLALVSLLSALHSNTGAAYIALGKPYIHTCLQGAAVLILFPLVFYIAPRDGIDGVAYAYLIANGSAFLVNVFIACRLLNFTFLHLLSFVIRPMLAALAMFWSVSVVKTALASDMYLSVKLALSIATGGVVFAAVVLLLWFSMGRPDGAEVFVLENAKRFPVVRRLSVLLLRRR